MSSGGNWGAKLYRGEVSYDFVGRQKLWYAISGVILLVAVVALLVKGLVLGIEFKGGAQFSFKSSTVSVAQARDVVAPMVRTEPVVQKIGNNTIRIQTAELTPDSQQEVTDALVKKFGLTEDDVSVRATGPSWGEQITKRAMQALIAFLVLVVLFLSVMFEWKLALAALAALVHDMVITVGIYALVGFEVTPGTVIGFLTILGYSLYDTVVVFDKVRENTRGLQGGSRSTYSEAANLAVNQTLVRSINTTVIALLPVGGLLFIGAGVLGAGTLKDLALVLFIGMAAGTYSSIFIATPLAADLKEREPQMKALRRRVEARRSAPTREPAAVASGAGAADDGGAAPARAAARPAAGSQRSQPRGPSGPKGRPSGKRKR